MNRSLMEIVVNHAVLFELASDDVLNPDVALSHLESMVHSLRGLSPAERAAFVQYVREREAVATDAAEREFLAQFVRDITEEE